MKQKMRHEIINEAMIKKNMSKQDLVDKANYTYRGICSLSERTIRDHLKREGDFVSIIDDIQKIYNELLGIPYESLKTEFDVDTKPYNDLYDGEFHTFDLLINNRLRKEQLSKIIITYSLKKNGPYVTEKPSFVNSGHHTVYLKIEKDGFFTYENEISVNIKPLPGIAEICQNNWIFGEKAPELTIVSSTNDINPIVTYKNSNEAECSECFGYSKNIPVKVGEYGVKAVFPACNNYSETTATAFFKILPAKLHTDISIEGFNGLYDKKGHTLIVSNSPEDSEIHIEYADITAAANIFNDKDILATKNILESIDFHTAMPVFTNPGKYTVAYRIYKNENYEEIVGIETVVISTIEKTLYGRIKNDIESNNDNKKGIIVIDPGLNYYKELLANDCLVSKNVYTISADPDNPGNLPFNPLALLDKKHSSTDPIYITDNLYGYHKYDTEYDYDNLGNIRHTIAEAISIIKKWAYILNLTSDLDGVYRFFDEFDSDNIENAGKQIKNRENNKTRLYKLWQVEENTFRFFIKKLSELSPFELKEIKRILKPYSGNLNFKGNTDILKLLENPDTVIFVNCDYSKNGINSSTCKMLMSFGFNFDKYIKIPSNWYICNLESVCDAFFFGFMFKNKNLHKLTLLSTSDEAFNSAFTSPEAELTPTLALTQMDEVIKISPSATCYIKDNANKNISEKYELYKKEIYTPYWWKNNDKAFPYDSSKNDEDSETIKGKFIDTIQSFVGGFIDKCYEGSINPEKYNDISPKTRYLTIKIPDSDEYEREIIMNAAEEAGLAQYIYTNLYEYYDIRKFLAYFFIGLDKNLNNPTGDNYYPMKEMLLALWKIDYFHNIKIHLYMDKHIYERDCIKSIVSSLNDSLDWNRYLEDICNITGIDKTKYLERENRPAGSEPAINSPENEERIEKELKWILDEYIANNSDKELCGSYMTGKDGILYDTKVKDYVHLTTIFDFLLRGWDVTCHLTATTKLLYVLMENLPVEINNILTTEEIIYIIKVAGDVCELLGY